ncbi:MAG: TraR/DksA C4-type zinc finger protein [Desulfonatronovibrio sp.]
MISREIQDKAYQKLQQRRSLLQGMREETGASSERLSESQVEMEELAQQEKMQQELQDQDRVTRDELYDVNMALQRIQAGTFGICQECGEEISEARLQVIPWAEKCINCASEEEETEQGQSLQPSESSSPLAPDYQGLSDEQLCNAIRDRIRYDGRVAMDDLRINCQGQKVIFSGALPSQEQSEIIYEIVEDTFGVHEIEDNISIDRVAWQRKDRTPDEDVPENSPEDYLLEGRPQKSDPFSAVKEGESMDPEDKMVYEKQENTGIDKDKE